MKILNLTLALAAGLTGGILSRYLWPLPVQAQAPPPASQEIHAQRFVLEDAAGKTLGTFSVEAPRNGAFGRRPAYASIRLFDEQGREVWRSPNRVGILPATE